MGTEKIRNCFKKYGIDVAIKRKNKTIFDFIKNNGTEDMPALQKRGVYEIKCEECKMTYVYRRNRESHGMPHEGTR